MRRQTANPLSNEYDSNNNNADAALAYVHCLCPEQQQALNFSLSPVSFSPRDSILP